MVQESLTHPAGSIDSHDGQLGSERSKIFKNFFGPDMVWTGPRIQYSRFDPWISGLDATLSGDPSIKKKS